MAIAHTPPQDIKAARKRHGLTLAEAARLVQVNPRTWSRWEAGDRKMPPGSWELFTIKVGGEQKKEAV